MSKRKPSPKPVKAPVIGQIVHYRLSAANVETLTNRHPTTAAEDDLVVLTVTGGIPEGGGVNGQVLIYGEEPLWVTAVPEGDGPGTWCWPPKR